MPNIQQTRRWLLTRPPAVVASGPTTWDDTTLPSGLFTLDAAKLVCSLDFGGAVGFIRSTTGANSGLKYFSSTYVFSGSAGPGLTNGSETNSGFLGTTTASIGYLQTGVVQLNSSTIATIATFATGDTVNTAIDYTNSKIWFRINGAGNWNNDVIGNQNPVGNVGGISIAGLAAGPYYAAAFNQNGGNSITGNFLGTPPSGYSNY